MSDYNVTIKIAGQLQNSFKSAILGARTGLSGLGASGKVGSLALRGVGVAAKATAATLAAAGASIIAVGTYSEHVGKQFESAMSQVAATMNTTVDQIPELEALAEKMGQTTVFSATEAAEAINNMAMAGYQSKKIISTLPSVLHLASAGSLELDYATQLVANGLNVMGMNSSQAADLADKLAVTASNAYGSVSDFGEGLLRGGKQAKLANLSIDDTLTALGILGDNGIQAAEGGTYLRNTIKNLYTPTSDAAKALAELGVKTADSKGRIRDFQTVLSTLGNSLDGLTEDERMNYMSRIFDTRTIAAADTLIANSGKRWDELSAAIENSAGAAEKMSAVKLDNLEGDITLCKSAADGFGIAIYKKMKTPLRGIVQYGTAQIGILQSALSGEGFDGLPSALGEVIANGATSLANGAPAFIDMAADMVESFIDGIDKNAPAIGSSAARLGTALITALLRIVPRMIATGGKLITEFAHGIVQNFPKIKAAGAEAVEYLMTAAKNALKNYVNFLGDDEVAPFEKILALIPAVIAGFAGFAVIDGIAGGVKGLVSSFKGVGKAAPGMKKGLGGVASPMSALAKNALGLGAGLALAAAGIMIMVNAAKQIASAGPGAAVALILMAGGLAVLMGIASALASKLQAAQGGLIAFGAAILIAGAGMALMVHSAIQLAGAGGAAIATFAGMAVAIAAFMVVAGTLGPELAAGGAGMLALGAGIVLAAAGMTLLVNSAIQLSSAGAPAIITMAALAVGILAFGVAVGVLAPILIAGAAALAAFGVASLVLAAGLAALTVTGATAALAISLLGASMLVFAAGAAVSGAALLVLVAGLAALTVVGAATALAIALLGASMLVFAAGAAVSGAASLVLVAGLAALAVAGAAAALAFAPLTAEMVAIAASIAVIAVSATAAAAGITTMKGSASGMVTAMAKLAVAFAPVAAAIVPYSAAVVAGTAATVALAAALVATDAALAALLIEITTIGTALLLVNSALAAFRVQAGTLGATATVISTGFSLIAAGAMPMATALLLIVPSISIVNSSMSDLAASMTGSVNSITTVTLTLNILANALGMGGAAFVSFAGIATASTVQTVSIVSAGAATIVAVIQGAGSQIVAIAYSTANGVRSAFMIDLTSSGRFMMQGLINGMNSMRGSIMSTAASIANAAADAVNNALKVGSPSKVMIDSGEYTGDGFAIGMKNRVPDIRIAAQAMTRPVIDESQRMRAMDVPVNYRSGIIPETVDRFSGNESSTTNNEDFSNTKITYSPTFVFQGGTPDEDTVVRANKRGQDDFEKRMEEWIRKHKRISFA